LDNPSSGLTGLKEELRQGRESCRASASARWGQEQEQGGGWSWPLVTACKQATRPRALLSFSRPTCPDTDCHTREFPPGEGAGCQQHGRGRDGWSAQL